MNKIKLMLLSGLFVGLCACGKPPVKELGGFEPYVDKFVQKSNEAGFPVEVTELKMEFGT